MPLFVAQDYQLNVLFRVALFAALFGGSIIGFGILAIARHGAGVVGVGVIALILQRARGWNAGRTQMGCDVLILLASLPVLSPVRRLALRPPLPTMRPRPADTTPIRPATEPT